MSYTCCQIKRERREGVPRVFVCVCVTEGHKTHTSRGHVRNGSAPFIRKARPKTTRIVVAGQQGATTAPTSPARVRSSCDQALHGPMSLRPDCVVDVPPPEFSCGDDQLTDLQVIRSSSVVCRVQCENYLRCSECNINGNKDKRRAGIVIQTRCNLMKNCMVQSRVELK